MPEKALVVDDSASMRQMVNFTLTNNGFEVIEAQNGKDAIEKLKSIDSLKVIVSDIHMPEMNGIELVKYVRSSNHKFVPIVILTTESEEGKKNEGMQAGATAWIVKPFTPDNLISIVKKVTGC